MINPRLTSTTFSLLAVLLTACASATSTAPPAQPTLIVPTATIPAFAATVDTSLQAIASPTAVAAPTTLPVATSRGPNLEATDPTTVKLASGSLQLVEFFEFW